MMLVYSYKVAFFPCCFAAGGLWECRHCGIPGGQTRQALLHWGQLSTPGWTHGHGRNHWVSSRCWHMQKALDRWAARLLLWLSFCFFSFGVIFPHNRCNALVLVAWVEKSWKYGEYVGRAERMKGDYQSRGERSGDTRTRTGGLGKERSWKMRSEQEGKANGNEGVRWETGRG